MDRTFSTRLVESTACCLVLAVMVLLSGVPGANARITTLTITNTQPAFGGATFGPVGSYEVITGTFTDEVDPDDPHNAVIVDIEHGPKNANGAVSFTADFQIIKPTNLANSAHRLRRAREASKPRGDIFIGCDPLQSLPPGRAGEAGQRFFASLAHGRAMALSALGQQR
jgi:hypothetical protein